MAMFLNDYGLCAVKGYVDCYSSIQINHHLSSIIVDKNVQIYVFISYLNKF